MQHYEEYEDDIYHVWNENFEDGYTFQCKMPKPCYDYRFEGDLLVTTELEDCEHYEGETRIRWTIWRIPDETLAEPIPVGHSVGTYYWIDGDDDMQHIWEDAAREIEHIRSKE